MLTLLTMLLSFMEKNNGDDKFTGFTENEWHSTKETFAEKLKSMPIKKSLKTKQGKGCLFIEDEETTEKVKNALSVTYNVEVTTKPKFQKILPKVKMFNIDSEIYKNDKPSCKNLKTYSKKNSNKPAFSLFIQNHKNSNHNES